MRELVQVEQTVNQADHDSWTPANLNDLPETPPIEPILGGTHLVYPGKRHVFSGPPESAKTLAAYCVLIQIARQGGTAILIDFEMGGYDARQRLRELSATHHEISRIAYLEPDEPATVKRIAALVATKPDLVVIDASAGIYSLEGLDDNKRGDVEKVAALYVKLFWRHDIATILIDHVVKDGEARGRWTIGSERKLGGADVHLGFDTVKPISRGTAGQYKIVTHKDRGGYLKRGHLADLHLDSAPDTNHITWQFSEPEDITAPGGYKRPTFLMERVSRDLELRHEPVSRNQVSQSVKGTKDYVVKAIDALVIERFVAETAGPNNSKLVESTRPYREDNPVDNPQNTASSPVVRQLFGSCSANNSGSGCSVVRPPYGGDTAEPPTTTPKNNDESARLFGNNGTLVDSELAWLDELAPDHDPNADPNP